MELTFFIISQDHYTIEKILEITPEFQEFSLIGFSSNELEASDIILKYAPDLVFIDMDNPGVPDPFKFINQLYHYLEALPDFIAISKTKEYAYEVIKNNFYDYLLKPLHSFELRKTLMRFKKRTKDNGKLCLKSYSDYHFIQISDILYLHADNNTTDFYLGGDKKVSAYHSLKYFEESLPVTFVRVHKSYMVNTQFIRRINFTKHKISLENNKGCLVKIPFSRTYRKRVDLIRDALLKADVLSFQN